MTLVLLLLACALAFANGANDTCKGVASLVASGEAGPRRVLFWAAATTALGAGAAALWDGGLLQVFRAGFVAGGSEHSPTFFVAVLAAAIAWVLLATATGLPVSTTHALLGGLVGAGLAAVGSEQIEWAQVASGFALPLALGPLVSLGAVYLSSRPAAALARRSEERCACLVAEPEPIGLSGQSAVALPRQGLFLGHTADCARRSPDAVFRASTALRITHWSTTGLVGFARGWNDTPKIAALAVVALPAAGPSPTPFVAIAVAMALGGLLAGRRVLATLARRLATPPPLGESLAASAASAVLVSLASFRGLPLSTTHVTTGALVGAGLARDRRAVRWAVVRDIVLAWLVTLPASVLLALAAYRALA